MRVRINHERLAEFVSRSRLSQNHWAIKLGFSSGHMADLVNGRHLYASPATREKLVRGLEIPFEDLFVIETPAGEGAVGTGDLRARFQAALADRYIIDDVVGQGGMGTVYLGRDAKHGRQVAIKAVLPDVIAAIGTKQFLLEIRRTASMQHPNILPVLDSGVAAECPYLVTPYVKSGSLAQLFAARGPLSPDEALELLRGMCHALAYAHGERLVHCDVKPDNVLLSSGQAVLTDFGISRAIHLDGRPRSKTIDTSTGTPAYVSPEQVSGETVDGRSDLYSVACVAFEMLTGAPPFSGDNDMAVVSSRFRDEPPDASLVSPHVPYALAQVLRRGMAFDRRRRYQVAGDFLTAFEDALDAARLHPIRAVRDAVMGALTRTTARVRRALPARTTRSGSAHRPAATHSLIARGERLLMHIAQDIRYAARLFRRQPGFALVAVATLALGVGANTAIFSVIDGVLLAPLPYPEPDRLVAVWEVHEAGNDNAVAGANFVDWREQNGTFAGLSVMPTGNFAGATTILGGTEPARVGAAGITEDFFPIIGLTPLLGRTLGVSDFSGDAQPVVVVSHRFWQRYLAGTPDLSTYNLNTGGASFPVVGVMPPGFTFPRQTDVWFASETTNPSRTSHNWAVIGRLAPDVTLAEAQTDISGITRRLKAEFGDEMNAVDARVASLQDELVGSFRQPLGFLMGASLLVLLIACTNIASTLMAQGTARKRELSIRAALGAGRHRVIRQLLVESVALAAVGTVAGLLVGAAVLRGLLALAPSELALNATTGLDAGVIAFAAAACVVSALVFGLYPALRTSRTGASDAFRAGDRGSAGVLSRVPGQVLIAAEVALAMMLLVGSGLLIRSFWRVMNVDAGFQSAGVVTVDVSLPTAKYREDPDIVRYYDELTASLAAVPGVQRVGVINHLPLAGVRINGDFEVEGWEPDVTGSSDYRIVNGDYFAAMGIQLLRGRTFEARDDAGSPHVAVVNQRLVERYWPGENPVGKRVRNLANDSWIYPDQWITIVGVVADVRHGGLTADAPREIYVHYKQRPARARGTIVAVKTATPTAALVENVRRTVRSVDGDVPVELSTMDAYVADSVSRRRFTMIVLGAFGAVALALAAVGIYGVVSYSVSQRTREMGIRIALGAEPAGVRRLVQQSALATVAIGVVVGLAGSVALTRVVASLLYDVSPTDPVTLTAGVVLLAGASWLASFAPAQRATRVDPMVAIRE